MQYRFCGNAELMGEWAGVRNVLGSFRPQPASVWRESAAERGWYSDTQGGLIQWVACSARR